MIIASQTRFVCKPDLRFQFLGFFLNCGIFFLNPLAYALRVLLIGSPQRLLGCDSQLGKKPTNRICAQTDPKLFVDQRTDGISGPQGKRKVILPRVFTYHGSINPFDHVSLQLARAAASLLGIQGLPTSCPVHCQPVVYASTAEPQSLHNDFRAFPILNHCYRSLTKLGQHIMLKFSAIHVFHGPCYTTCI